MGVEWREDWLAEARRIVAEQRAEQLRMLYGTEDRERAAEIEAARMAESSRRKSVRERRGRIIDTNDDGSPVYESPTRNQQSGAVGLFQFMSGGWR